MGVDSVRLPRDGRAPGWHAGIVLANRQLDQNAPPRSTSEPGAA